MHTRSLYLALARLPLAVGALSLLTHCGSPPTRVAEVKVIRPQGWPQAARASVEEAIEEAREVTQKHGGMGDIVNARTRLRGAMKTQVRRYGQAPAELLTASAEALSELEAAEIAMMRQSIQLQDELSAAATQKAEAEEEAAAQTETAPPTPSESDLKTVFLRWPVEKMKITSLYGPRKSPHLLENKKRVFHDGTDFRAAEGTPIMACAGGVITHAKRKGGYGLMISVDHGLEVSTHYAHLSEMKVVVGQKVQAGEVIGLAGQTGKTTGPHLHLMVTVKGRKRDPMSALGRTLAQITAPNR